MLEAIGTILFVMWLLGMVSGYTLGNFIYLLLAGAIVSFLVVAWEYRRASGDSTARSGTHQP